MELLQVTTDEQINACFPVLSQLRPEMMDTEFLTRVRRQMASGYQMLCLLDHGQVVSVAGFRISENLAWGKYLYVDDLVTDVQFRAQGAGEKLLKALVTLAKNNQCQQLHLDSGVQRFDAHRFYLKQGMRIASHHFMLAV